MQRLPGPGLGDGMHQSATNQTFKYKKHGDEWHSLPHRSHAEEIRSKDYAPLPAEISTCDWAVSCTVAAQIDV